MASDYFISVSFSLTDLFISLIAFLSILSTVSENKLFILCSASKGTLNLPMRMLTRGVAEWWVQGSGPPSQDQDHLCESHKSDEFVGGSMGGGYHGCCMCHPGPICGHIYSGNPVSS
jgi:hypothetical protein